MARPSGLTQASLATSTAEEFTIETATRNAKVLFRNIIRKLRQEDRVAALEQLNLLMKAAMKRVQPTSHMGTPEVDSGGANSASTPHPASAQETGNSPPNSTISGTCREMGPMMSHGRNARRGVSNALSASSRMSPDSQQSGASPSPERSDRSARSVRSNDQEPTSSDEGDEMDSGDEMPRVRGGKRKRSGTRDNSAQQPKRPKIASLDELVGILQTEAPIIIRHQSYQPYLVVQDVMEELLQKPEIADMKDEALAGVNLLAFIFGRDGCTQFRSLYKEHHKTHSHKDLTTAKLASIVASDLKGLGCPTLSRLVDLWSELECLGVGPKCKDMRRLKAHLEIVRIWESINLRDGNQIGELETLRTSPQFQDFLDQQCSRGKRGQTKQSQLTSFIAHKLSIPNNKFTITASRYKPILILARYFGEGILAFLPRAGLLPLFNKLHLKAGGPHGKGKGELVFCAVIEKVLEKIPGITDLSSLAFSNLVEPILEASELPPTSGLSLLEAGEVPTFQSTDVWDLVTNEVTLERRIIEELSEIEEAEEAEEAGGDDSAVEHSD